MGNSYNANTKLASKQGDLSKLISGYLQENDNTFRVLNSNNKQIAKSNLTKVLNSKSILNNAKLLSLKIFAQYNSKSLNVNDYQSLLTSSSFVNEKEMWSSQLLEAEKLLKKDHLIYQKKLTIKTHTDIAYHSSSSQLAIRNKSSDSLRQSNSYCLNHSQISNTNMTLNQNANLNQSEYIRDKHNKTFDDMNLQEYLNEETKNIRRSISLRHDSDENYNKKSYATIDKDDKFSYRDKSKRKSNKKTLSIQSNNHHLISKKDNSRYNTINSNSLYENEYFYNKDDTKTKNVINNYKVPIETDCTFNLLKNRYTITNPKATSYQSFRTGIKVYNTNGNGSVSGNACNVSKKNTIPMRNTALAEKQLSRNWNTKDSLIKVLKKEKITMRTLPNTQTNKSHLQQTPKTSRVTSPKTAFTSKPVTSYSSRNISYIANQQNSKQCNPVFNIKIDLRELMKEDDNNGLMTNDYDNTIEVPINPLSTPTSSIIERKRDERNSNDRSSLEGLIITRQMIDVNGKITI